MSIQTVPSDLDAERALIGAVLQDRNGLLDTRPLIDPGSFHSPANGHLWAAICTLDDQAAPIDPVGVHAQLAAAGHRDLFPAVADITQYLLDAPSSGAAPHYARIVARHADLRALMQLGANLRDTSLAAATDPADLIDTTQAALIRLAATDDHALVPVADAASDWLTHLQDVIDHGGPLQGATTGLHALDDKLCGLRPGQMIVIAGRPGSGKSLLGAHIALHAATAGTPTLFVTVEMGRDELTGRLVAAVGRVDATRLRSGRLHDTDWPKISRALGILETAPLAYLDQGAVTVGRIRAEARRLAATAGLGLIVVDYLQLLQPAAGRRENRQVEVADLSGSLKRLARELHVPVVALAQLNRGLEMRADKRPTMADLRESGAIENDADVIIGIYRDEMYRDDSPDNGTAELIVLKQRSGPLGAVTVSFRPEWGLFADLAHV